MRRVASLLSVLHLALAPTLAFAPAARAQDDAAAPASAARALFTEGVALADRGEYEAAVDRFQRSLEHVERASTLFNLGVALRELGRDAEAIAALERFLAIADASIDDAARGQARTWIASMRRDGPDEDAGATASPAEPEPEPPQAGEPAPEATDAQDAGDAPSGSSLGNTFAIVAVAIGGAALVTAISATIAREDQLSRYHGAQCAPAWGTRRDACPELRTEIEIMTGVTAASWTVAIAFGAAGALVFLLPRAGEHGGQALAGCAPSAAPTIGVACAGRF